MNKSQILGSNLKALGFGIWDFLTEAVTQLFGDTQLVPIPVPVRWLRPSAAHLFLKTSVGGIMAQQIEALRVALGFAGSESSLFKSQVEMFCSS